MADHKSAGAHSTTLRCSSSSTPTSCTYARKSGTCLEHIHFQMREKVQELLDPHCNAEFRYRLHMDQGQLQGITYEISGADPRVQSAVQYVVSSALVAGIAEIAGSRPEAVVQSVRLMVPQVVQVGVCDDR